MYKDYQGEIVIDTKDNIITMETYAKNYSVDTEKYEIMNIEVMIVLGDFKHFFNCKNKIENGEIEQIEFKPSRNIFEDFCKSVSITIKNK